MSVERRLSLRALQAQFHAHCTRPTDSAGEGAELAEIVDGDERFSARSRLELYASMYRSRLLDSLSEDYPKLLTVLGRESFERLMADYLGAYPPRSHSLRTLGANLPAFLANTPLGKREWLRDLARLEWARVDLFDGPDAQTLDVGTLQTWSTDTFSASLVCLVPCHRLMDLDHSIQAVWEAIENEEIVIEPQATAESILVWRKEITVYHRTVERLEAEALRIAEAGSTFGDLCEVIAADAAPGPASRTAFALLSQWIDCGLVARAA